MFLLKKAPVDLSFKSMELSHQLIVVLLCSGSLVSDFTTQLHRLVSQLAEGVLALAVYSPDFELKVSELKIHLGSGLEGNRIPIVQGFAGATLDFGIETGVNSIGGLPHLLVLRLGRSEQLGPDVFRAEILSISKFGLLLDESF